jgi:hypothetical protein
VSALEARPRTTSLASYAARFPHDDGGDGEQPPEEEFICLLAIALEVPKQKYKAGKAISAAAKWFANGDRKAIRTAVEAAVPLMEVESRNRVISQLESQYDAK